MGSWILLGLLRKKNYDGKGVMTAVGRQYSRETNECTSGALSRSFSRSEKREMYTLADC